MLQMISTKQDIPNDIVCIKLLTDRFSLRSGSRKMETGYAIYVIILKLCNAHPHNDETLKSVKSPQHCFVVCNSLTQSAAEFCN